MPMVGSVVARELHCPRLGIYKPHGIEMKASASTGKVRDQPGANGCWPEVSRQNNSSQNHTIARFQYAS